MLDPRFSATIDVPILDAMQRLGDGLRYEQRLLSTLVDQSIDFKVNGENVHFQIIMRSLYPIPLVINGTLTPRHDTSTKIEGKIVLYSLHFLVLPIIAVHIIMALVMLAIGNFSEASCLVMWVVLFSVMMWVRVTTAIDRLKERFWDTLHSTNNTC